MDFDVFEFPVRFHSFYDLGDKGRYKVSVLMESPVQHYGKRDGNTNEVTEVEVAVMSPEGERLTPQELPVNGSLDKFHCSNDYDQGIFAYVPVNVVKGFLKRLNREERKAQERKRERYEQAMKKV